MFCFFTTKSFANAIKSVACGLFIIKSLFFNCLNAQNIHSPKIESPNAAGLGVYGEVPVNLFSGTPNISIPLHSVIFGDVKVPIELSYHSSSVKPSQNPGWTGLGWNLVGSGSITRSRKGVYDDFHITGEGGRTYYPRPDYPEDECGAVKVVENSNWTSTSSLILDFNSPSVGGYDAESDEFSFNFMGYSGRFYYAGPNRGWYVISDQKLKVELTPAPDNFFSGDDVLSVISNYSPHVNTSFINGVQSRAFKSFTITTPDGTKYKFGGADATEFICLYTASSEGYPRFFANTWFLKEITDKNGHKITFNYQRDYPICSLFYGVSNDSYTVTRNASPSCTNTQGYSGASVGIDSYSRSGNFIWPVYLSTITTANETVTFKRSLANSLRFSNDELRFVSGGTASSQYILEILNNDLNNLQWQRLDEVSVSTKLGAIKKYQFNYNNSANKRLLLSTLNFKDNSGSTIKTYTFNYNNLINGAEPPYGGDYTDHWGFFNNKTINSYLFSQLASQKNPDENLTLQWLLNKITYPTSGYTTFEWKAHQYSQIINDDRVTLTNLSGINYAGGGRIEKITNYSKDGTIQTQKRFLYVKNYVNTVNPSTLASSGVLNGIPQYLFAINQRKDPYGRQTFNITLESINSVTNYSLLGQGAPLGYTEVVEVNNDNSYTINHFSSYARDINQKTHFDEPPAGMLGWIATDKYVPYSSLESERGKLVEVGQYNASNIQLTKRKILYRDDSERFNSYFKRIEKSNDYVGCDGTPLIFITAVKEFSYSYYPISEQVVMYDQAGNHPVTTTTSYEYNVNDLVSKKVVTDSKSDKYSTQYTYPFDYNSEPYQSMTAVNLISPIIEEATVKNDIEHIESTLNAFYSPAQHIYVPKTISKKIGTADQETQWHLTYDAKGSLQQEQKSNDLKKSYQWGYNNQYPIVQVINAENSLATATTVGTNYGSINTSSSSASSSFITEADGNIVLSVLGDPGNTYTIFYNLAGPTSRTGRLCAPQAPSTCSYPEIVTLTNMPKGRYSLQIDLASESNAYLRIQYSYPGNQITTVGIKEFFYQGFEEEPTAAATTPYAGKKYYSGDYTVPYETPNSRSYMVNYRYLDGTVWKSMTKPFASNMTLTDGSAIDEVRVYPSDALMTTYTYEPLIGMSSQTDPAGRTTHYEYDGFGRLQFISDQDKNVIKRICYNYQGQEEECAVNINPTWQTTGNTRCQPCPSSTGYTSNIQEHEEKDTNPNSPTYTTTKWVPDEIKSSCEANAAWQNTATAIRCKQNSSSQNTGEQEQEQKDVNPCSATYNQLRWVVTGTNTSACSVSPVWSSTGAIRCQLCSTNSNYTNNTQEHEEKDTNPSSATYNTTRWVSDGVTGSCTNAVWQNTATASRCKKNSSNQNTGEQEQEQKDVNPCSATYNQLRWVVTGTNTTACPLPVSCSFSSYGVFMIASSTISKPTSTVNFSISFGTTSSSVNWYNSNQVATINGGCKPASTKTISLSENGRSWQVSVSTTGAFSAKLTGGTKPGSSMMITLSGSFTP